MLNRDLLSLKKEEYTKEELEYIKDLWRHQTKIAVTKNYINTSKTTKENTSKIKILPLRTHLRNKDGSFTIISLLETLEGFEVEKINLSNTPDQPWQEIFVYVDIDLALEKYKSYIVNEL